MKKRKYLLILLFILFVHNVKAATIEEQIPDANLRACMNEMLTTGKKEAVNDITGETFERYLTSDGQPYTDGLTEENLKKISILECTNKKITNAEGVGLLTNLIELNLSENNIENITLSSEQNPKLITLYLGDTNFKTLNVNEALTTQLKTLSISGNGFNKETIDGYIKKFPRLETLYFDNSNYEGELDVSSLKYLSNLFVNNNKITSVKGLADKNQTYTAADGSEQTISLNRLSIDHNKLTTLDLSGNPKLKVFIASNNSINSIDLSKNTELVILNLLKNSLPTIDLTNNTKLTKIVLSNNKLQNIDLSKNTLLKNLSITSNSLSNLDVTNNINLEELYCSFNKYDFVDLSKNTALKKLEIDENKNLEKYNFTNLSYVRTVLRKDVPAYKVFNPTNLKGYIPSNIEFTDYKAFESFSGREDVDITDKEISKPSDADYYDLILVPTNPNNTSLKGFTGTYEFGAYYRVKYMTLTSDRYYIKDDSIIVAMDDNDTIKKNLHSSFDGIEYVINGLTLSLKYEGVTVKEFNLDKTGELKKSEDPLPDDEDPNNGPVDPPKTGVFISILGIIISAIGAYVGLSYCHKNSRIRNI